MQDGSEKEKRFGRYSVTAVIGRGAMGIVYRAEDTLLGRTVALKTLNPVMGLSPAMRKTTLERFNREVQTAARLQHPGIIVIYDYGLSDDGVPFMAMELVEGEDLQSLVKRKGSLPLAEGRDLICQLLDILDYAHREAVIHRDIKPPNIIISSKGRLKLADFGIVRVAESTLTAAGAYIGSPEYSSPEQIVGKDLDRRSDLYSAGLTLYFMLTGKKPFQAAEMKKLLLMILNEPAPPPSRQNPAIPAAWDSLVLKALEKDPDSRYQTAAEFLDAIRELGKPASRAPEAREPAQPRPERPGPETRLSEPGGPAGPLPKKALLENRFFLDRLVHGEAGQTMPVPGAGLTLGREGCDANLDDPRVSRKHARIEIIGQSGIYLKDLASSNGTFLNENRVSIAQLRNGDIIRVGDTRFRFRVESGRSL
jgi:serine/threonine-protein kinase